jgi:CRISPR-associated protein Csx14
MSDKDPNIRIPVDLTNPGQFFACCGLLELADRLWPGAEGWFERREFCLRHSGDLRTLLACLILDPPQQRLFLAETLPIKPIIAPLAITLDGDATTRFVLDFWAKIIVRSGTVHADKAPPWNMWSGQLTSESIWLRLRDELRVLIAGDKASETMPCTNEQLHDLFRQPRPFKRRFGFDSTAAWNPQDVGFSPNDQKMDVESSPATELLAAVGLQRFRPVIIDGVIRYQAWKIAASPAIAATLACGGIRNDSPLFHFEIVDRGQYSAFGKARPMKGEPTTRFKLASPARKGGFQTAAMRSYHGNRLGLALIHGGVT